MVELAYANMVFPTCKIYVYFEQEGEQFVKKIGGVFAFKVRDGPNGQEATWFVDVKNGKGCVHNDTGEKSRGPGKQNLDFLLSHVTVETY